MKKKIFLLGSVIAVVIIFLSIFIIQTNQQLDKINKNSQKEEVKKEITYELYAYSNDKIKLLVTAIDTENGIHTVKYPENDIILTCNGKEKVAFDYEIDVGKNQEYTFLAYNELGEEIKNTIVIDEMYRQKLNELISVNQIQNTKEQIVVEVDSIKPNGKIQYKIGKDTTQWVDYTQPIVIDGYQLQLELGQKEASLLVREVSPVGEEIVVEKKIDFKEMELYHTEDIMIEGESIFDCIQKEEVKSGNYIFAVNGEQYLVEVFCYDGDSIYDIENNVQIGDTKYTNLGSKQADQRMLVLKYTGSLMIKENTILTPMTRKKGLFVYAKNKITNYGEISMTARGAVATGQDVYLYKNIGGDYEYVPAIGATGGSSVVRRVDGTIAGTAGANGSGRQTGGGGAGAAARWGSATSYSGAGANGTSYSGGSAGGGCAARDTGAHYAGAGSVNGGAGGYGRTKRSNGTTYLAGGGAGNSGGMGSQNNSTYAGNKGSDGTGGLLMMYSPMIENYNAITANGSYGGYSHQASGGSSGSGSINIFYRDSIQKGTITATSPAMGNGGPGGNGTITIGSIYTGTFEKEE